MPPAMKRLLADLQLPANRFDRRALVEVHLRLAQLRNDLLRRVSLPFHRVLPPSRAVRLSYQLVHLEGVRSRGPCAGQSEPAGAPEIGVAKETRGSGAGDSTRPKRNQQRSGNETKIFIENQYACPELTSAADQSQEDKETQQRIVKFTYYLVWV